jgi:hypothetical protein
VANLKATCKWLLVIAVQEIVVLVTAALAMVVLAIAVQVTVVLAIAALEIVAPETGAQVKS